MGWGLNKRSARFVTDDAAQSLIEVALTLPLLLVLLLGMVDGARAYYVAGIIANASREAVNFAARSATATHAQVAQRACDASGFVTFGQPCPGMSVTCSVGDGAVTVEVVYDFSLLIGSVVNAAFKINPIPIRAIGRFPILSAGTPCVS